MASDAQPVLQGTVLTMPGLPVGTVVNVLDNQGRIVHSGAWKSVPSTGQPVGMRFAPCMTMASENRALVVR